MGLDLQKADKEGAEAAEAGEMVETCLSLRSHLSTKPYCIGRNHGKARRSGPVLGHIDYDVVSR